MRPLEVLARSPALWNRQRFDLRSDEILAQLLDRGTLDDWRALYTLAGADADLRARIVRLAGSVPMYLPNLWLAAMRSLGELERPAEER
jgi:hypothetical protein